MIIFFNLFFFAKTLLDERSVFASTRGCCHRTDDAREIRSSICCSARSLLRYSEKVRICNLMSFVILFNGFLPVDSTSSVGTCLRNPVHCHREPRLFIVGLFYSPLDRGCSCLRIFKGSLVKSCQSSARIALQFRLSCCGESSYILELS